MKTYGSDCEATRTGRAYFTGEAHEASITYYDDERDQRVSRDFWAPRRGGYVQDVTTAAAGTGPQVCTGLARLGDTLRWHPSEGPLVDMIRREWRRARAARKE